MSFIVEEINRSKKVMQRQRFAADQVVTVGRALDNDVILSEPHVSPYHIEIIPLPMGGWKVRDLNSENGVRTHKRTKVVADTPIVSGDTLLLGRSYVRIWDVQHQVDKTWQLHGVEDFFHAMSAVWVSIVLLAMFIIGEWQLTQLQSYQELSTSRIINNFLYECLVIVGWAASWSLSGRVTRHDSRFLAHFAVTLVAAMLFLWAPYLLRTFAYNGGYGLWLTELRYFVNGAIFSLLLWCNFYLTIPQKSKTRIIWSNAIAWSLVLVFLMPTVFESQQFRGFPLYDRLIMPPAFLWEEGIENQAFIEQADALYQAHVTQETTANAESSAIDETQVMENGDSEVNKE